MDKQEFVNGDEVWVPFWVLLEFLDNSPPDPFVKCKIVDIQRNKTFGEGYVDEAIITCDLEIKKDLIANTIPLSYLIDTENLNHWADKIGQWFINFRG
jgi:hypothetical protein